MAIHKHELPISFQVPLDGLFPNEVNGILTASLGYGNRQLWENAQLRLYYQMIDDRF